MNPVEKRRSSTNDSRNSELILPKKTDAKTKRKPNL